MRHLLSVSFLVMLGCLLTFSAGCSKEPSKPRRSHGGGSSEEGAEKLTPLVAKGWATLKGKVTLDGPPPEPKILEDVKKKEECMKDAPLDTQIDQTWLVGKDNALPNVAIWVQPPKGRYFKLSKADVDEALKGRELVKLQQPHCAFEPHVLALCPIYKDGEEEKESGQKFEVVNNALFPHNTLIEGDPLKNPTWNSGQVPAKTVPQNQPKLKPQDRPLNVKCDIHPWMRAKIWVLDTPFYAVTGKDGTFEIKHVPAGVKLHVVAWHEGGPQEWRLPEMNPSEEGQEIELKADEVRELNFKVKMK
jgi:hypothetical protein